jgi:DNA processing protein
MIREHGSASAALAALPDVAASAGVTDYQICLTGVVMAELKTARTNNARLLVQGTPDFTAALDDLDDAPPLLWSIGDTSLLARPVIAMVGARNASSLGTRIGQETGRRSG